MTDDHYVIWSNEHNGWWKPHSRGYATGLNGAGFFTREEALMICHAAMPTATHLGRISEIPVRLKDLTDMMGSQRSDAIMIGAYPWSNDSTDPNAI
jgi:hypothetical protein